MSKLDEILSQITDVKVNIAKIETEIKLLPELHTKVDDLCTRMTTQETQDKAAESYDAKKIKRYSLVLGSIGIGLTVYNSIVSLFT